MTRTVTSLDANASGRTRSFATLMQIVFPRYRFQCKSVASGDRLHQSNLGCKLSRASYSVESQEVKVIARTISGFFSLQLFVVMESLLKREKWTRRLSFLFSNQKIFRFHKKQLFLILYACSSYCEVIK